MRYAILGAIREDGVVGTLVLTVGRDVEARFRPRVAGDHEPLRTLRNERGEVDADGILLGVTDPDLRRIFK